MDSHLDTGSWYNTSFLPDTKAPEPATIMPKLLWANHTTKGQELSPAMSEMYSEKTKTFKYYVSRLEKSVAELVEAEGDLWINPPDSLNVCQFTQDRLKLIELDIAHHLHCAGLSAKVRSRLFNEGPRKRHRITISDDSDLSDEESAQRLQWIFKRMLIFLQHRTRQFSAITGLTFGNRRQFHAIAHVYGLSHISLGEGPQKTLLLSKKPISAHLKRVIRDLSCAAQMQTSSYQPYMGPQAGSYSTFGPTGTYDWGFQSEHYEAANQVTGASGFQGLLAQMGEVDLLGGFSSTASSDSATSFESNGSGLKRRRQSRHKGAFICFHEGCGETFDRKYDLRQHERSHLPYELRPYGCEFCEKRFLFPKDLRRHEATHRNAESIREDPDEDGEDERYSR